MSSSLSVNPRTPRLVTTPLPPNAKLSPKPILGSENAGVASQVIATAARVVNLVMKSFLVLLVTTGNVAFTNPN